MFDIWVALAFGILGYIMRKVNWPIAPLILGYILGSMLETALRNSMQISFGSLAIFIERPICATFLALTLVWIVVVSPGSSRETCFSTIGMRTGSVSWR